MASEFSTPPEIAERLRVDPAKVVGWIRAGELRASNVATKRTGRPRWRISEADLQAFLAARMPNPPTPRPASRRRVQEGGIIPFFA